MRTRLLRELARRFDVPVTMVVAGAGFGKTTALAQAVRANHAEPRGVDAWISCEAGDEDAGQLSAAIVAALGRPVDARKPTIRVLDALGSLSPLDVCLVLDDVHQLPTQSTSAVLLEEVVRQLPANAHLLIASREPIELPVARLRAAAQVIELHVDDLAFTQAEAGALAELHGADLARIDGLAGWPSLVRLVLSAPSGAERQFLWEEIVTGLSPEERAGLLALAALGWGSAADIEQVANVPVDVAALMARVPLLTRDDHGVYGIHQLWEESVERLFLVEQIAEARERALSLLQARGETLRLGTLAARWRAVDPMRAACVALVRGSFGALPVDTATQWLSSAPEDALATPELDLLTLATRHAVGFDDPELDSAVDALAERFAAAGDTDGHAVTLALGAVVAHFRGDQLRLFTLAERVQALPAAGDEPVLRFLTGAVSAALAGLAGDLDGTLRALGSTPYADVPRSATELVTRLHVATLVLAGRADEAVGLGEVLARSPSQYVRGIPAMLRWHAGDPSGFGPHHAPLELDLEINERDRLFHAAYGTAVAASFGDVAAIESARAVIDRVLASEPDARDSAMVAVATGYRHVLDHDEPAATQRIEAHLARYPPSNRLGEVHLRRSPVLAYVCHPDTRHRWDQSTLGPSHQRSLAVARQLLDGRAGRLTARSRLASPSDVFTSLPLPWSVELAALAEAAGCRDGQQLVTALADWAPVAVHEELYWLAEHAGGPEAQRGAATLLRSVPDPSATTLRIEVLGPLRLLEGDEIIDGPESRRARVRALLGLLALHGPVRRERVMDLMWPELEPAAASRNLRVTLSRLRQLVEPGRQAGQPSARLRVDAETLSLAAPPRVEVDLWELRRHLDAFERSQQVGDSHLASWHLEQATGLWRGDPLPDLHGMVELTGEVEQVRRCLVDATLRLGELQLVAGRFDESLACAERARAASPYFERAHRLAIAAHLQRRDHEGVATAVAEVEVMLADLRLEAEPATQMLVRQARTRIDSTRQPEP